MSTKRMAGVEFVAAEVVGGIEAETAGTEFVAEFLLFAGETLEFRFGGIGSSYLDEKGFEQTGHGSGLLGSFDPGRAIQLVIHADGDVLHDNARKHSFTAIQS